MASRTRQLFLAALLIVALALPLAAEAFPKLQTSASGQQLTVSVRLENETGQAASGTVVVKIFSGKDLVFVRTRAPANPEYSETVTLPYGDYSVEVNEEEFYHAAQANVTLAPPMAANGSSGDGGKPDGPAGPDNPLLNNPLALVGALAVLALLVGGAWLVFSRKKGG